MDATWRTKVLTCAHGADRRRRSTWFGAAGCGLLALATFTTMPALAFLISQVSIPVIVVGLWLLIGVTALAGSGACFLGLCRLRIADGVCPPCGYDLSATPGRCPECGGTPTDAAAHDTRRRRLLRRSFVGAAVLSFAVAALFGLIFAVRQSGQIAAADTWRLAPLVLAVFPVVVGVQFGGLALFGPRGGIEGPASASE